MSKLKEAIDRVFALNRILENTEGDEDDALDDMVHDAASRIGSAVNNGGLHDQVEFLLEQGITEAEIMKELEG